MKLTVLGNAAGAPGPDGACPGYLIEAGDTALLLDCGPGVIGKLVAHRPVTSLTAAVFSHLHLDHVHDLPVLLLKRWMERASAVRRTGGMHTLAPAPDLAVYLPPGGIAHADGMLAAQGMQRGDERRAPMYAGVRFTEYDPAAPLTFVGPTRHFPGDCYAMRITDATGALFAYSGDTAPDEIILRIAQDADLFLCEATLIGADGSSDETGRHLTTREAGMYAARAGVRSLLLTHMLLFDADWYAAMEAAARETYTGPLAHVGYTATISPAPVVANGNRKD